MCSSLRTLACVERVNALYEDEAYIPTKEAIGRSGIKSLMISATIPEAPFSYRMFTLAFGRRLHKLVLCALESDQMDRPAPTFDVNDRASRSESAYSIFTVAIVESRFWPATSRLVEAICEHCTPPERLEIKYSAIWEQALRKLLRWSSNNVQKIAFYQSDMAGRHLYLGIQPPSFVDGFLPNRSLDLVVSDPWQYYTDFAQVGRLRRLVLAIPDALQKQHGDGVSALPWTIRACAWLSDLVKHTQDTSALPEEVVLRFLNRTGMVETKLGYRPYADVFSKLEARGCATSVELCVRQ